VGVFDTKKHSNVKRHAEYRRIGRYYKSVAEYKAEKQRRRLVLELHGQGLTHKQIAERLGVSESTVKRDLQKWRCYVKGRFKVVSRELERSKLDEFVSLNLKSQVDRIQELSEQSLLRLRTLPCSALVVTVDVDAALEGRYALKFAPRLPVDMLANGKITVELLVQGRRQILGRVYVGEIVNGAANLQTNQSVNALVKPVLAGLRVVEVSGESPEPVEEGGQSWRAK
jgi:predicted transcriptional regulator